MPVVKLFLLVLLPLILGICIYEIARPESTIVLPRTGVTKILKLPSWVIYNVPDGLWLFSFLNCLYIIWYKSSIRTKMIWIMSVFLLALLTEVLQKFHFIPGTFDINDILAYSLALILSTVCNKLF